MKRTQKELPSTEKEIMIAKAIMVKGLGELYDDFHFDMVPISQKMNMYKWYMEKNPSVMWHDLNEFLNRFSIDMFKINPPDEPLSKEDLILNQKYHLMNFLKIHLLYDALSCDEVISLLGESKITILKNRLINTIVTYLDWMNDLGNDDPRVNIIKKAYEIYLEWE